MVLHILSFRSLLLDCLLSLKNLSPVHNLVVELVLLRLGACWWSSFLDDTFASYYKLSRWLGWVGGWVMVRALRGIIHGLGWVISLSPYHWHRHILYHFLLPFILLFLLPPAQHKKSVTQTDTMLLLHSSVSGLTKYPYSSSSPPSPSSADDREQVKGEETRVNKGKARALGEGRRRGGRKEGVLLLLFVPSSVSSSVSPAADGCRIVLICPFIPPSRSSSSSFGWRDVSEGRQQRRRSWTEERRRPKAWGTTTGSWPVERPYTHQVKEQPLAVSVQGRWMEEASLVRRTCPREESGEAYRHILTRIARPPLTWGPNEEKR